MNKNNVHPLILPWLDDFEVTIVNDVTVLTVCKAIELPSARFTYFIRWLWECIDLYLPKLKMKLKPESPGFFSKKLKLIFKDRVVGGTALDSSASRWLKMLQLQNLQIMQKNYCCKRLHLGTVKIGFKCSFLLWNYGRLGQMLFKWV